MYQPSKKTLYLVMAFASMATLGGAYHYWDDISFAFCDAFMPEKNAGESRLTDIFGQRYTLLNHGDGKESALYDQNRSVTFHKDEGGNLVWDAGLAGLLPAMASSYYHFYGFSAPAARMDIASMTYRLTEPLRPYEAEEQTSSSTSYRGGSHYVRFGGRHYDKERSPRASFIGQKMGFGSAGARSSSS